MYTSAAVLAFLALHYTESVNASPLEKRGGNVCSSGIYGELVPVLAPYAVAQSFCSRLYPVACTSAVEKRHITTSTSCTDSTTKTTSKTSTSIKPSSTTKVVSTTVSTTKATTTQSISTGDPRSSAWAKCQGQVPEVISTLCSCIEVPKACATKSTTASTKATGTISSSTTTTASSSSTSTTINTSSSTTSTTTSSSTSTTSTSTVSTSTTSTTSTTPTTTSVSTSTSTSTTSSSSTTSSTSSSASATPTTCQQLEPDGSGDYTAANGDVFFAECGYYRTACHRNTLNGQVNPGSGDGSNPPGKDGGYAASFRDCLEQCSTTPTCAYIQWQGASNLCQLENATDCGGSGPYDGYDRASLQSGTSRLLF